MNKIQMAKLIVDKKKAGVKLTTEETANALVHFTQKEIDSLYMPNFNCAGCYRFNTENNKGIKTINEILELQSKDSDVS